MSLEQQIANLAASFDRMAGNASAAVAEIIRQRDNWQRAYEQEKSAKEYFSQRKDKLYEELEHERRVSRGLRSAIKRMKAVRS